MTIRDVLDYMDNTQTANCVIEELVTAKILYEGLFCDIPCEYLVRECHFLYPETDTDVFTFTVEPVDNPDLMLVQAICNVPHLEVTKDNRYYIRRSTIIFSSEGIPYGSFINYKGDKNYYGSLNNFRSIGR